MSLDELDTRITTRRSDSGLDHLPWRSPSAGTARPAVRDVTEELSYRGLERRAAACAEQFAARGIGRGDVVAIMLPNSVAFLAAMLGAWRVGAAVTPVNPTFTERELRYQLDDSGARLLVTSGAPAVEVETLAPTDLARIPDGSIADPPITPDTLALLVYTSGSTGQPKGVMLDHANLSAMAASLRRHIELGSDDQALLVLPLFHVNSLCVSFLAPISAGGSVSILERFAPGTFLDAVQRYRPTYFSAVPAIFARLAEVPREQIPRLPSLRLAICGAAPASPELLALSEKRFGIPILEGYGLTEATCASACNPLWGERKPGTVGRALPGQQIAILDDEGRLVPPGVRGEVAILSPTVMRGYLGRPDATAEVMRGGWLRTGDIGILDEDAYLTLVDRAKDMIIRGGENLYPKEIEGFLATHPAVLEAAVIGRPDPVYGEVPIADVVLHPGEVVTEDQLRAHCAEGLTKIKVPAEIRIVTDLARNPVGKVDKPAMRRALAAATA